MAGAGYKQFADGDVLTAAQVQTFLQDQTVMRFADSSARDTALGTAVSEGMLAYLDDTDEVLVYDGASWGSLGLPLGTATPTNGDLLAFGTATSTWNPTSGLDASIITTGKIDQARLPMKKIARFTSNGSWTVPSGVTYAIAHVLGGGGGIGNGTSAGNGGLSRVAFASGNVDSNGGTKGVYELTVTKAQAGQANSGRGATASTANSQGINNPNSATYIVGGGTTTPGASVSVTVGNGGSAGTSGAAGGSGYVYIEYYE